jgi:hypothetical protein
LPSALAALWKGCGGTASQDSLHHDPKTEAGIKLTLRWDLLRGGLDGPHLQAAKTHELHSVLQDHPLQAGSLWCADLGYWMLTRLAAWAQQGVFFLIRYKVNTIVWYKGARIDLFTLLPKRINQRREWCVDLGASRQVRQVRLLALRVPQEVVAKRKAHYQDYCRQHQKPLNPVVLHAQKWTLLVTNVPPSWMSLSQAFALAHARWQIELLFKLWKSSTLIDTWNGTKPMRVLCEIYAKLLAVVIQHWFLLLASWDDPDRSWQDVAQVVQDHIAMLVHGLAGHLPLRRVVRLIIESVRGQCCIPARSTRPSTSRLLQGALPPGLT